MGGIQNSVKSHIQEKFPGELDDDREELLIAADFAGNRKISSHRACSKSFWKNMECYFTSVTSQEESYLKHQLDFAHALSGSLYQISGDGNVDSDDLKLQQHPIYSGGRRLSCADQESTQTAALTACSDINMTYFEAPSLCQILMSAIIEDDKSEEMSFHSEGRNGFQCASDGFQGVGDQIPEKDMCSSLESIASPNCNYLLLSMDDKLRLELQSIDLCPETIAEGEDTIHKDIIELEAEYVQQVLKKKKYIRKIYESIQHEKDAENRNLEQAALSERIVMGYKKLRVSHMSEPTHAASEFSWASSESPWASSPLNLDIDCDMQDQDWHGLDIPMDDLFDVPLSNLF